MNCGSERSSPNASRISLIRFGRFFPTTNVRPQALLSATRFAREYRPYGPLPTTRRFGLAAAVCVCALSASVLPLRARSAQDGQFDVVIRGGQLVDGTGAPARRADIGIRGDVIAVIGDLAKAIAKQTIDAPGLVVAPGFIDMHSHSDFTLLADGRGLSKVTQGVTTELLGEAGSAAPVLGPARGEMENTLGELNLSLDWTTFPQYSRTAGAAGH